MALLTIVVPCYRNAANIRDAFISLQAMEADLPEGTEVEYVAVDDGSEDATFAALLEVRTGMPERMVVLKLTRNFGVYNALSAAFTHARGDCVTVFPPDLQEPVELIPVMFDHWRKGIPVVGLMRTDRQDGFWNKVASWIFHRTMDAGMTHKFPRWGYGTGLIDRKVMQDLLDMKEKNSNTLLLMAYLAYPYVVIPYNRAKRVKGRSGWSFRKRLKLFIDSTVAFTYLPIRAITLGGMLFGVLGSGYAITILFSYFLGDPAVEGWTTIMIVLLLTASFQMMALGVLGEYLWRTLDTVRDRPAYVIEQALDERHLQNGKEEATTFRKS
jgi:polyisoprenyl-phosphate glycosyltransferase